MASCVQSTELRFIIFIFYMFGVDGQASEMDTRGAEAHRAGTHPLHGFVT